MVIRDRIITDVDMKRDAKMTGTLNTRASRRPAFTDKLVSYQPMAITHVKMVANNVTLIVVAMRNPPYGQHRLNIIVGK